MVVHTDNDAASRIVQVGSNKPELQEKALKIFDFCKHHNIDIKTIWIPREINVEADRLSKQVDIDDWQLSPEFFNILSAKWGPFTIDRFADNENAKVPRFNSKFACPSSEACDAFSQKWENEMNLLVPPVREIPKVINHINRGHIRGVLVIPYWTSSQTK